MKNLTLPVIDATDYRFQNITTVIVKVTHRCNLNCTYCYENNTADGDMPITTFKSLVDRVFLNATSQKVNFIFHGGEPTLLPDSWYEEAIEYAQTKANIFSKKAEFGIQSNLISITNNTIELFKRLKINLSVSLDGPSYLPNQMRPKSDQAIDNFQKAKSMGLNIGVLMTINHSNYNRFDEIMRWLENNLKLRNVKINTITLVEKNHNLPNLKAEEIFKARQDILEYMIDTKGLKVIEDNLKIELLRFFTDVKDSTKYRDCLCHNKICEAGNRIINITPEGYILPCGRFQWNDQEYFLGHLEELETKNIFSEFKSKVNLFHQLIPQSWNNCSTCNAANICSFGCKTFIIRSKEQINIECLPTKFTYQYFEKNKSRLQCVYENTKKRNDKKLLSITAYSDWWPKYDDYHNYADYSDKYSDYVDKSNDPDPIKPPPD